MSMILHGSAASLSCWAMCPHLSNAAEALARPLGAGMLPFARELVKGGTEVVLAANEVPSINDITAEELRPLLQRAAQGDAVIGRAVAEGVLRCVSSGSADPIIHLGQVSSDPVAHLCSNHKHWGTWGPPARAVSKAPAV